MKLHYSQTRCVQAQTVARFYYLMKLHYSQTSAGSSSSVYSVLLPYEITLFSNLQLLNMYD